LEQDLGREVLFHIEERVSALKSTGLSEEEARRSVRQELGGIEQVKEECRDARGVAWLETTVQDLHFGLRTCRKNPGSTTLAVLTLALGIGANTAIFGLLNAVLLRNLPVPQPNQLVLFGNGTWVGSQDTLPNRSWQLFSYPFYNEFWQKNRVFSNVAAIDSILFDSHGHIGGEPEIEKMRVELVSGTYFQTLGLNPALGRLLTEADDQTPGAHPVVVASYSWWQRRFAKRLCDGCRARSQLRRYGKKRSDLHCLRGAEHILFSSAANRRTASRAKISSPAESHFQTTTTSSSCLAPAV
jgi:hypothetical protein